MNINDVVIVNDGQNVTKNFIEHWGIEDYCHVNNNNITVSFVGIVIKKDDVLFSFPKHYNVENINDKNTEAMKQILELIFLNRVSMGSFDRGNKNEFPAKAYLQVANYYKKYGLYFAEEKYYASGYAGNIDWKRTINKSNHVIQNKGIVFFPFILKKSQDINVFLSDCMAYVLDDAARLTDIVPYVLHYKAKSKNKIFNNLEYVLKKLQKIKWDYFKDQEKSLIQGLIDYIKWKSESKDNIKFLTLNFEDYWEKLMEVYLNKNFCSYDNDLIVWSLDQNKDFHKPKQEYVESRKTRKNRKKIGDNTFYRIEFDHYMELGNSIYIFDSKYFNESVKTLNYKQAFYHYYLKAKNPNKNIINGLLLPTEEDYHAKVHIDRSDIDNVKIVEHYINLKEVLDCALKHKELLDFGRM